MKNLRLIVGTAFYGGFLLLGACSSSNSGSSDNPLNDGRPNSEKVASARAAVVDSISNTMDASVDGLNTVVNNSTAVDVLFGNDNSRVPVSVMSSNDLFSKSNTIIQKMSGISANGIMPLDAHMGESSPSDDIVRILNQIMDEGTVEGGVVVYRPNIEALCVDSDSAAEMAECENFLQYVSVEQQVTSDTEGKLTFKFDTHGPFVIGYASNSVYLETIFAELNNTLVAIDELLMSAEELPASETSPSADITSFDTFEGAIRLTITKLGDQHGSSVLSIPQAISISGMMDGEFNSLTIAQSSNVFGVEANGLTNEAAISFGLGAIAVVTAIEDMNDSAVLLPTTFDLAGLTGVFTFNGSIDDDVIAASGVGLGDSPISLKINGTEALNVAMDTMDFTVSGNQQSVTLDTAMNLSISASNLNGELSDFFASFGALNSADTSLQASLGTTAPSGTVLTDRGMVQVGDQFLSLTEVTSGSFSVAGTGFLEGNATVNQSQCFADADTNGFPYMVVDCLTAVQ